MSFPASTVLILTATPKGLLEALRHEPREKPVTTLHLTEAYLGDILIDPNDRRRLADFITEIPCNPMLKVHPAK